MEQRRSRRIDVSAPRLQGAGGGRGLAALLICAVLALSGALLQAPGAAGAPTAASLDATTDPESVRWTVKPADADGADGRRRIETSADPGTTIQEHMAVKNLSNIDATFALSAADGLFNQNGRFDMLPADQESVDAGTWIELPSTVSVPARKTVVVPVTIVVPADATPGEHVAGVAAAIVSDAGNLQVVSRVGFRVAVDVSGEVTPALDLEVTEVERWAVPWPQLILVTLVAVVMLGARFALTWRRRRLEPQPDGLVDGPLNFGDAETRADQPNHHKTRRN